MCMFKFGFCRQGRMGERKILRQSAILAFLRALTPRPIFSSNFFWLDLYCKPAISPPPPSVLGGRRRPNFRPFSSPLPPHSPPPPPPRERREREKRKRREPLRGGVAVVVAGRYQRRSPDPHSHRARSAFVRRRLRGEVAGFFFVRPRFYGTPPSSSPLSSCRKRRRRRKGWRRSQCLVWRLRRRGFHRGN